MAPFSTARTTLKLLAPGDFEEILSLFHEPDTFRFIPHLQQKTKDEYRGVLVNRLNQIAAGTALHWTARTPEGELVGVLNYSPIAETDRMQLGFQIRSKFHRQGYATELARAVVHHLRTQQRAGQVYGVCSIEHIASATVLERIGFKLHEQRSDIFVYVLDLGDNPSSSNEGKSA
ncbi:MAG TPA: GNAT family N-acetyltransferase [Cyclobacteriaceae bacterium]|nr:GNAT family N-acetyltransferase [Cyclobacteriaceae bacterium]